MGFETKGNKMWMDGKIVDWSAANVHVLTHGLHYASSVFEGTRVYGGKIFKMEEHNARLMKSAKILGFEIPYTLEDLNKATLEAVEVEGIENGYIRPVAWCGTEKMAIDRTNIDASLSRLGLGAIILRTRCAG